MTPRVVALLALACWQLATAVAQPPTAPPPRPAPAGSSPLPPGVIARLGSPLFRTAESLDRIAVSPDGRTIYGRSYRHVYAWDASTGRPVFRVEVGLGIGELLSATLYPGANGVSLVARRSNPSEGLDFVTLDPTNGRELNRTRIAGQSPLAFSPDGSRSLQVNPNRLPGEPPLLVPQDGRPSWILRLCDPTTGREIAELARGNDFRLQFSPDGRVVVAHQQGVAIKAFEATTGKPVGEYLFGGDNGTPVTAVRGGRFEERHFLAGPGGKVILFWMLNKDKQSVLRAWEPGTGKNWDIGPGDGPYAEDALAISPDGTRVATFRRNVGWLVRELATGKEIARRPVDEPYEAGEFSPDGGTLYTHTWYGSVVVARDLATGKVRSPEPDPPGVISQLEFTGPDTLVGLSGGHVLTWDAATGRRVAKAGPFPLGVNAINAPRAMSPDGRRVLRFDHDGVSDLCDVATGRVLWSEERKEYCEGAGFGPDGRRVYVADRNELRALDADTGTEQWKSKIPTQFPRTFITVDPTGRWLAHVGGGFDNRPMWSIRVWDAATGELRHRWQSTENHTQLAASAPDGRLLYVASSDYQTKVTRIRVLDPVTGSIVNHFGQLAGQPRSIAVSPDGRMIAVATSDGRIHLIDPAAGGVRHTFEGHIGRVEAMRFRPDGRVLAAASSEAPVYLWDVYGTHAGTPKPTAAELTTAWDELASADAAAGFRAVKALVAGGNESLPVLKARMAAVRFPLPEAVAKLIAELDADDFATREKASKDLAAIARLAEPQLRAAAKDSPSPEVRKRAGMILSAAAKPDGEELRAIRAVEAAEVIGTVDAAKLLAEWASGTGVLAREAKAATVRVKK